MFKVRLGLFVITFLLAVLLAALPAVMLAQDAPPEPDVTATPDPLPAEPEPEPGGLSSIVTFLTGALAGGITVLLSVLGVVTQLKDNKQALDTIEYLSRNTIPLEVLARFNELAKAIQDAGAVLDVVTDGQPNEGVAEAQKARSRAEPPPPF